MLRHIIKTSALLSFGELTLKFARLFAFIMMAKIYSQTDIGFYNYALNFLGLFYIVGEFGLNPYIVTEQAKKTAFPDKKILALGLAKQLTLAVVMLIGYALFATINKQSANLVALSSCVLIFADANLGLAYSFYRAKQLAFKELFYKISQSLIYIIFCAVIYFINVSFLELITVLALANLTLSLFAIALLMNFQVPKISLKSLIIAFLVHKRKILPLFLAAIFTTIYFKVDVIMIEHMLGAPSAAMYSAAYKLLEGAMALPWMLNVALAPRLATKNFNFTKDIILQLAIGLFSLSVLFYASSFVIQALFPPSYALSVGVAKILSFSIIIMSLNAYLFNYFLAQRKTNIGAYISFIMMIFNILANYYLIPIYNIDGSAYATVLTELVGLVALIILTIKDYSPNNLHCERV